MGSSRVGPPHRCNHHSCVQQKWQRRHFCCTLLHTVVIAAGWPALLLTPPGTPATTVLHAPSPLPCFCVPVPPPEPWPKPCHRYAGTLEASEPHLAHSSAHSPRASTAAAAAAAASPLRPGPSASSAGRPVAGALTQLTAGWRPGGAFGSTLEVISPSMAAEVRARHGSEVCSCSWWRAGQPSGGVHACRMVLCCAAKGTALRSLAGWPSELHDCARATP